MIDHHLTQQHLELTRRYFLGLGVAGAAALANMRLFAGEQSVNPLTKAVENLQGRYITPADDFGTVERGDPLPYTLPPDRLQEVGLVRESWRLEVVADPESNSQLDRPLSKEQGTGFDWDALMKLAETRAVRYLKVMTCNNGNSPLGMGLWEGVPLRDVIWLAQPKENIRHIFYYGYHNDDPKQMFQCWLPINRVLEDPPGELPVMLAYKLNGDWLSGKRGGPVRMLVPESYGFKSVKWLNRVLLTNNHRPNDTYADGNNDTHSWLKTFARFAGPDIKGRAGQPIAITGIAQVGISGLAKVQYWVQPKDGPLPADDPYLATAVWQDAEILPPPSRWNNLPDGRLPEVPLQFDPTTGQPRQWPLRYTVAHWAVLAPGLAEGKYDVRCRTIDAAGQAQPLPRPFAKSGRNSIQRVTLSVEA
jgi:DMSO/TMAO reductase YedYZ molybdopterin-dependent catalytic subunit